MQSLLFRLRLFAERLPPCNHKGLWVPLSFGQPSSHKKLQEVTECKIIQYITSQPLFFHFSCLWIDFFVDAVRLHHININIYCLCIDTVSPSKVSQYWFYNTVTFISWSSIVKINIDIASPNPNKILLKKLKNIIINSTSL